MLSNIDPTFLTKFLVLFTTGLFSVFCTLDAQELSYDQGWMIGIGLSQGNIRSAHHSERSINDALLVQELENFGPRTGWQLSLGYFRRISRSLGWTSEFSIMHSRRKGQFSEVLKADNVIYNEFGDYNFNNIHLQLFSAPRFQFGTFNRFFVSLGPYVDYNLLNLSSFDGTKTSFYEKENIDGEILFRKLDQPQNESSTERSNIRQIDFGGMTSIGTLLALPGDNLIHLEFQYSRGAFRISDTPRVRQNRFLVVISYVITDQQKAGYKKYMPYQ